MRDNRPRQGSPAFGQNGSKRVGRSCRQNSWTNCAACLSTSQDWRRFMKPPRKRRKTNVRQGTGTKLS